mmetsp:Transcript_16061/g.18174  ORF Transcript_16061/g.18174 Transcript_16061/m.18174 type:complete len:181 (+) Transcript_16061:231-773(+)|eukprot:CAMPEP_0184018028 /NCGR_PEP_ID=MMETSP0954-20121128/7896_1 /TAXON_ID=627963 /ORGANISM="Aplanochytrium sp, Strain PBS07" /LENGTH=180 /DNA_ID=CAMNT_0026299393 /DNA_START=253 /DNA_END=795 /DNA_ORIENTATION=-
MATSLTKEQATALEPSTLTVKDGRNFMQGKVLKRRVRYGGIVPCLTPTWRQRFLVLRGKYLFRFTKENEERLKGTPIPLEAISATAVNEQYDEEGEIVPYAFRVSTIRKTYVFAVSTVEERDQWVREIQRAKNMAIKKNLGHAKVSSWEKRSNIVGKKLYDQAIDREVRRHDMASHVAIY